MSKVESGEQDEGRASEHTMPLTYLPVTSQELLKKSSLSTDSFVLRERIDSSLSLVC